MLIRLTSIIHPTEEIEKKAAGILLKLIQDRNYDANYLFTPELTTGNSVRDIRNEMN